MSWILVFYLTVPNAGDINLAMLVRYTNVEVCEETAQAIEQALPENYFKGHVCVPNESKK